MASTALLPIQPIPNPAPIIIIPQLIAAAAIAQFVTLAPASASIIPVIPVILFQASKN
jgi:hypothetical protein